MPQRTYVYLASSLTLAFVAVGMWPAAAVGQSPTPVLAPPAIVQKAPAFAPYRVTRRLAPGVELIQDVTPDGAPGGPLVVTVIQVNPREKGVRLQSALGSGRIWQNNATQGRERVSQVAVREKATAAINTAFFTYTSGHPIGLFITDGSLVTEPAMHRAVFGMTKDGKPVIASYDYKGTVEAEGGAAPIALGGLNRRPSTAAGKSELLLFTPVFFDSTLPIPGRVEVALSGVGERVVPGQEIVARVVSVMEGGKTPLAPGTAVLSGSGTAADWLRANATPGKTLRIRNEVTPVVSGSPDAAGLAEAVAGSPRLVTGGQVTIGGPGERVSASFSRTRHPRTAVGITREGTILLLTVDGRQKGLSRGASLAETAALLVKFGAVDGVNMDGGGSTTLAVNGAVINSPSDNGSERPVAAALLVYARPEAVSLVRPEVALDPLAVGDNFIFKSVDKGNAVPAGSVWATTGGIGFIAQDGRFFALRPGTGAFSLIAPPGRNSRPATSLITVMGPPPTLLPPEDPGAPQGGKTVPPPSTTPPPPGGQQ